jgi:TadE-like protein
MKWARMMRRRWRRMQRGQALLEFAMFFLFLTYLLAGTTNIGGLLNDHISVEYATRQGARTGAVLGNQGGASGLAADCAIIGAIDAALVGMPSVTLNQITIYKAGPDGQPDPTKTDIYAGNSTCTVSGTIDTISPGILNNPPSGDWPPSMRNNQPFQEDSLGVRVDYTYTFNFPLLPGGTFTASDYAVMPIDPVAIPSPVPSPTQPATAVPTA